MTDVAPAAAPPVEVEEETPEITEEEPEAPPAKITPDVGVFTRGLSSLQRTGDGVSYAYVKLSLKVKSIKIP